MTRKIKREKQQKVYDGENENKERGMEKGKDMG